MVKLQPDFQALEFLSPIQFVKVVTFLCERKTAIPTGQSSSAIDETDGNDILQNCVICLSEKRDGTWMNVTALHRKWFLEIKKKVFGQILLYPMAHVEFMARLVVKNVLRS